MDHGEAVQQFCAMTGADSDFALSFLEANGWDVELSVNVFLESGGGGNEIPQFNEQGRQSDYRDNRDNNINTNKYNDNNTSNRSNSRGNSSSSNIDNQYLDHFEDMRDVREMVRESGGDNNRSSSSNNNDINNRSDFMDSSLSDADLARALSEEIPPEVYSDVQPMDDDVRAPILPVTETLVDPYERMQYPRRQVNRRNNNNINGENANVFTMFRDFRQESRAPARAAEDQNSKKLKTLADLFRPPVDLLEVGLFEDVKEIALQKKKWLLVNIQEETIFDCQKMNRDTWADAGVKSVVRSHFVLWQQTRQTEEGARYCRFYPVEILPHLSIIDSRTGERVEVSEGFIEPPALIAMLEHFVATNSFDDMAPSRPKPQSPKRLGDLSEEAQLAAAMAASLGQPDDSIPPLSFNNSLSPSINSTTSTPIPSTNTSTISTISTTYNTSTSTSSAPVVNNNNIKDNNIKDNNNNNNNSSNVVAPPEAPKKAAAPALPANFKEDHANPSAERSCVIQIRTPSGAIKGHFKPEDTVRTVWQYVSLHLDPDTQFSLISSFPKKVYSEDKLDLTLKEAELVPRAVLICEIN